MKIVFYGSSILSSYWNGAATYYRGIVKALAQRGHHIVFCEPDAFDRQQHRDMEPPDWCEVVVYPAQPAAMQAVVERAAEADVVVKASGVGVFDDALLDATMAHTPPDGIRVWWDVDAPATLASVSADPASPLRRHIPDFSLVLTYGGGQSVVDDYLSLGACACVPVYNGLDPETHYPVKPDRRFAADLAFLGNRLPDREARVEEFFMAPARRSPGKMFLLGGAGWDSVPLPGNTRWIGHVGSADHNAFNATPLAVLNVNRESMARRGHSPATRVFEAAGASACILTDAWDGIEDFLTPGEEILVARDAQDVAQQLDALTPARARAIGEAARARTLAEHTYQHRAHLVETCLFEALNRKRRGAAA